MHFSVEEYTLYHACAVPFCAYNGMCALAGSQKAANISLKGAHLHVIGDLIQSIGVMVGAALICINPEWYSVCCVLYTLYSIL